MNEVQNNGVMDWDDAIENDGEEFVTLPEGDYIFRVANFERGYYESKEGSKLPSCPEAVLTLAIDHDGQTVNVFDRLKLHKSMEWRLASFFRAIGLKKHGERLVMDWAKVPGAMGRVHLKPRKYKGADGEEKTVNNVNKYIDYDESKMPDPFVENVTDKDLPWNK